MGILTPQTIRCMESIAAAQRTREIEYLGEVDFVSSNQDVASILTGFNKINDKFGESKILANKPGNSLSYYQHTFGDGKACETPKRIDDVILYK